MDATSAAAAAAAQLADAEHALPGISGERYLSAVALTALLQDIFLTFPEEKRLIWTRPVTSAKVIFVFLRYTVLLCQFLVAAALGQLDQDAHLSNGHVNHPSCRGWMIFTSLAAIVTLGLADCVLILRVYALWDHRRWVLRALLVGFALSYCSVAVFGVISVRVMLESLTYDRKIFHMCLIMEKPVTWVGIWASQLVFDMYAIGLTIANAASRPRGVGVKLIQDLRRDGGLFFVILVCGRLMNLALTIVNEVSFIVLAFFFVWSLVTITVTRLILRIEHMKLPPRERRKTSFEDTVQDEYELPRIMIGPLQEPKTKRERRAEAKRERQARAVLQDEEGDGAAREDTP